MHILVPIVGDGACLFRALSFFMYGNQGNAFRVRKEIVTYIKNNWVEFSIMPHDRNYEAPKICGDGKFYEYFRMSISSFEELLSKIAPRIQKQYVFRKPVEPLEMLGLTIR